MERNSNSVGRGGYQNLVLTVIAGALTLGIVERHSGLLTEPAAAQPQSQPGSAQGDSGLANGLEQRKQTINELRLINSKLERLEAKLNSGLSVKVTEMPAIKFPQEPRAKGDKGENAAEPAITVRPDPKARPAGKGE